MDLWWFFSRVECFPHCGCEPMVPGCLFCQPVAIISSAAYLAAAFALYYLKKHKNAEFMGWGGLLILVGFSSMFAHSNYTYAGMALDFTSITYLQTFFFFYRLMKKGFLKKIPSLIKYTAYFFALYAIYVPLDNWSQFYVCLVFFAIAAIDFLREKKLSVLMEKSLVISFGILAISTGLMLMDKTFCSMNYIPYGHTMWHIGSAFSAYYFGKWYFLEQQEKILNPVSTKLE